jgi:hypothetical protein
VQMFYRRNLWWCFSTETVIVLQPQPQASKLWWWVSWFMKLQNGNDVATFKIKPSNFGCKRAWCRCHYSWTLEAGDKSRVSVLKPLYVTTAGSGNIIAALPGTQTVGGRPIVCSWWRSQWNTNLVDGIRVAQPYGATTNNLPTEDDFLLLFSGISFSTGGYSAEYGEALSSVLLLNTQDEPDQNKTLLMTVGLGIGNTQKWKKVRWVSMRITLIWLRIKPQFLKM